MSQKPRIFCLVSNDLNHDQRMLKTCQTLHETGFEVGLVGRIQKKSKPLNPQAFQQYRLNCWVEKGKFFYLLLNLRLFFFLLFRRWEIVCAVDLDTILAAYWAAKLKRKKCVYDAHEYFTEVPELVARPRTRKVWEWVAQHTIPNVQAAYTVCESLAAIFEQKYGKKFAVVRNVPISQTLPHSYYSPLPANNEAQTASNETQTANNEAQTANREPQTTNRIPHTAHRIPHTAPPPKIILYQGALNEGRGLETAIMGMSDLSGYELWLAGDGDMREMLQNLAQKDPIRAQNVRFLGNINPKELVQITQKAFIGLNLLENKGLNYYFSLANKFFDYMQAEKPSIGMNFPEYARINTDCEVAVLLEELSPKAFVAAVLRISEPIFYQKLADNCRIGKKVHIWEEESKILANLYNQLI
jgi:glycosyltransferase involved in cell wall biosynthesis